MLIRIHFAKHYELGHFIRYIVTHQRVTLQQLWWSLHSLWISSLYLCYSQSVDAEASTCNLQNVISIIWQWMWNIVTATFWILNYTYLFVKDCYTAKNWNCNILVLSSVPYSVVVTVGLVEVWQLPSCAVAKWFTRGQSNLTKSASRGAHSPVRGHPRGSKVVPLNSWGMVSY